MVRPALLFLLGGLVWAQEVRLPVRRVVLFTSGVAFFERMGRVEGDAEVTLRFPAAGVNDLLKSMVVQDLGGGRVAGVTYASRDPITRTLKTFAVDLTRRLGLAQLLAQVRGEELTLEAPEPLTGRLVDVETQTEVLEGRRTVRTDYLVLLTQKGLRRVRLDQVTRLRFRNPDLEQDLQQALHVLAQGHARDKKLVTIRFTGQGKRPVRVSYIQEAPVWKTSYRLVLGEQDKALLQGWALVENTTDEDWQEIELVLVSGRPISFVMDLYQPLYVKRPQVELQLARVLAPVLHEGKLASLARRAEKKQSGAFGEPRGGRRPAAPPESADRAFAAKAPGLGGGAGGAPRFDAGVRAAASGIEVGELFHYRIEGRVSLPRQRSAMLPIVNETVKATKLLIYNPRAHAKHPLNGVRLRNTTGLHLMQGPVTVFDGRSYAGDARLGNLAPEAERLISYALDLDTEVARESRAEPETVTRFRFFKGVLHLTKTQRRSTAYTVRNEGTKTKTLLVEHPRNGDWRVLEPRPAETTAHLHRFRLTLEPKKTVALRVVEERPLQEIVALTNLTTARIEGYLRRRELPARVREVFTELQRRHRELDRLRGRIAALRAEVTTIERDQRRIRENMQAIARESDLYQRYLKKFGDQETRMEELRARIRDLEDTRRKQQEDLDRYLQNLKLE